MARFEFHMPDVGEGLAEVEVLEWKVSEGDRVEENQDIADLETDKSVVSMPAPATGTIVRFAAGAGERVEVGALLLVMEVAESGQPQGEGAASDGPGTASRGSGNETRGEGTAAPVPGGVAAAPSARRLARELGVDLGTVAGTGPRGRITPQDVRRQADAGDSATASTAAGPATTAAPSVVEPGPSAGESPVVEPTPVDGAAGRDAEVEEVPLSGVRRRVAENVTRSYREIPHVAGFHEFVVPRLVAVREGLAAEAAERGMRLTYVPLVVRAVALALPGHPWLNAELDEDRVVVLLKKTCGVGIAMATPGGLLVPVVGGAERLDLWEIAAEVARLGEAAEQGSLRSEDLKGGTFTISNVGPAGGNYGTSLIRPPEVAILGLGRIRDRAVVENGAVVARPVLPVSLTFDHRVVDGEQALAFVRTLRQYLEDAPESLAPGGQS